MYRTLTAVCVTALFVVPTNALAETRKDPLTTFLFGLKVSGLGVGAIGEAFFKSVSGLSSESEVIDYRPGGVNDTVQKIPGRLSWGNITLKRDVNADTSLAAWRKIIEDGAAQQARRNGAIVLYDKQNKEIARWNIVNAWPSRLSIEIDPDTGDPQEVITLAVEGIKRQ